jgi:hypothetical protein
VGEYQVVVQELLTRLERTEARLPGWVNTAAWVLTFVFIWLAMTQVGLLFQGMEMLGYNFPRERN